MGTRRPASFYCTPVYRDLNSSSAVVRDLREHARGTSRRSRNPVRPGLLLCVPFGKLSELLADDWP